MRILFVIVTFAVSAAPAQGDQTGKWRAEAAVQSQTSVRSAAWLAQPGETRSRTATGPMRSGLQAQGLLRASEAAFQSPLVKNPAGIDPVIDVGELKGAKYRIDIPTNYNGSLVVYCHGYSAKPGTFDKDRPPSALAKALLGLGYAVAQSGYSKGGWAVKEAIEETEALRQHFVAKYGKPKRTYVTGHSMGGTITLATIETFPDAYDGALQMCGPVGPIHTMMQRRVFDTLVVFDYYFPGLIGSPVAISDDVLTGAEFVERIQKEATTYPDRLSSFQQWSGFRSDVEMAQVVAFYAAIQKELMARAGGNPFDNRNTLYQGSSDDVRLNRGVKRYSAHPEAVAYLRKYYTPKAEPKRPVLSLHTTYDPLVPAWSANAYGELARLNGGEDFYVQRFVARNGHCTFTTEEMLNAFRDLAAWVEKGVRPEAGEQK